MLETKYLAMNIKADGETDKYLTVMGYGSVFGNRDNGGDVVMPGAFKASIDSGRKPKMLWQHDPAQPIGAWDEMREDENGLYLKGRIPKGATKGGEVAALIAMGGIDGLSIGYRTKEYEIDTKTATRRLMKLDLFEASVVTFPMNKLASIYAMKADDMTERDLERALKEMGHSNRLAKAMAGGAWKRRADVLRDADTADLEQDQRDVDELKNLLNQTLQRIAND